MVGCGASHPGNTGFVIGRLTLVFMFVFRWVSCDDDKRFRRRWVGRTLAAASLRRAGDVNAMFNVVRVVFVLVLAWRDREHSRTSSSFSE